MGYIKHFIDCLNWDNIPFEVQSRSRYLLLDLLGTGLAATKTELHHLITDLAVSQFSMGKAVPPSKILFTSAEASATGSALAGGMTIDAVDAHDGHKLTKGHVGCAVLPALLSSLPMADENLTGIEFLTLLVAGYEIGTRSGIALHATAPDYHTSGAWNAVTCAALTSSVLKLNEEQFAHALGIAEYHGPRSQMMRTIDHPTMLKDGSGWGAMSGVSSAILASKGFTGAPAISVTQDCVAPIWENLSQDWLLLEQYVKGFPVCRWGQPSVAAALELKKNHVFDTSDIVSVNVSTFHEATRLFSGKPESTEQAQYAISYPIAAALVRGEVGISEISPTSFDDPKIHMVLNKIRLNESDEYNKAFPAQRYADVTVTLKNGKTLEAIKVMAKGDPETAYTNEEIVDKFFWLTKSACSLEFAEQIHDAVIALDGTKHSLFNLEKLLYQRPPESSQC